MRLSMAEKMLAAGIGISGLIVYGAEDLLKNGGAEDHDAARNWGSAVIVNTEAKRSGTAGFELNKKDARATSPDMIPVDSSKAYYLEGYLKNVDPDKPASAYFGLIMYDHDKKQINVNNVDVHPGTETELAADAMQGATSVMVVNCETWLPIKHAVIAFDVKPDYKDLPNFDISPQIDKIVKKDKLYEVMLKAPLNKNHPAGAKIRLHSPWGAQFYWIANEWVPNDWKKYSATIQDEAAVGCPGNKFWAGAKYVRVFVQLGNYNRIPQEGARLLADDISFVQIDENSQNE